MINKYVSGILILSIFVTICSCTGNTVSSTPEEKPLSELLKGKFSTHENLVYQSDTLLSAADVLTYYRENSYEPIWTTKKELTFKW